MKLSLLFTWHFVWDCLVRSCVPAPTPLIVSRKMLLLVAVFMGRGFPSRREKIVTDINSIATTV